MPRERKVVTKSKFFDLNAGLSPIHFFTVYRSNGSVAYQRSLHGRGNQGLMWGEGYINPPRGPNNHRTARRTMLPWWFVNNGAWGIWNAKRSTFKW